ncbi:MAG: MFS transporter, partial [Acidimicrobiia bacterium]|nr:MFS transporter [Acidimicrobiia bacterium]
MRENRGWVGSGRAMVCLGLGVLMSHGFGLSLLPAMLPNISRDLGVGYDTLGLVVASGLVAYAAGAASTARILPGRSARGVLMATLIVDAVGLGASATATGPAGLGVAAAALGFVAPISWSATLHLVTETVDPARRGTVMSAASGGAAFGVLLNGVLVQTSASVHSWRLSFVLAASLSAIPLLWSRWLFPAEITVQHSRGPKRGVLSDRWGRILVVAGLAAGVSGFPFNAFLTATAVDELDTGSLAAAALWWLIGGFGTLAAPVFGRLGDRYAPTLGLLVGAVLHGAGLVFLFATWSYLGLVVAAVGFASMNYPIWGLVGAAAANRFPPETAVRITSLGLLAASLGGATANAATGVWIERTGSFRGPVLVMIGVIGAQAVWYAKRLSSDRPDINLAGTPGS